MKSELYYFCEHDNAMGILGRRKEDNKTYRSVSQDVAVHALHSLLGVFGLLVSNIRSNEYVSFLRVRIIQWMAEHITML